MTIVGNIKTFKNKTPKIDDGAFINPNAQIIGDVVINKGATILPGVIIRGEEEKVVIGIGTVILNNSKIEALPGNPVYIGNNALIGHNSSLFGCHIEDNALVGISANIQEKVLIGEGSVVLPGIVIQKDTEIPARSIVRGIPGLASGQVKDEELKKIQDKRKTILEKVIEYGYWYVVRQVSP